VPADLLGVAGELGEEVAVAQDRGVAEQVRNDVDDAAVGHDVPNCSRYTGVTPVKFAPSP